MLSKIMQDYPKKYLTSSQYYCIIGAASGANNLAQIPGQVEKSLDNPAWVMI